MDSPELSFSLAYFVFSVCFVFSPGEFLSAGITVQNLFSSWLGSEDLNFIQYQVRRTSTTLLVHSALPIGYYLWMCCIVPEKQLINIYQVSDSWRLFFLFSLFLHLSVWLLVFYWSRNRWSNHPISRALRAHVTSAHVTSAHVASPQVTWFSVASSVNTEFRRIDKFVSGPPSAKTIITDSWLLKVSTYSVAVALQRESHVTVTESRRLRLVPDSPTEILTVRVESINPHISSFTFSLNSTEYSELREKLVAPIRNRPDVVIHRTLSELFLETFRVQVEQNQSYPRPPGQEAETCIGCMQQQANVKLVRLCSDAGEESECQQCFCKPMWCLSCLARWFSSRQDQQKPETWLSNSVSCPTCRATFCVLDVCLVT